MRSSRVLFAVCLFLLPATTVLAHRFEPALLDLREVAGGRFDVRWKLGAGIQAGAEALGRRLEPHLPEHCRPVERTLRHAEPGVAPAFWRIDCGKQGIRGSTIVISGLGDSGIDAMIRVTWLGGSGATGILRGGQTTYVVPGGAGTTGAGSWRSVLGSYLRLGVDHILRGPDHLLFVLALLLLVRTWPLLIETITAFTVAHSITLALAVLGVVSVPSPVVDALVALSILLLAAELLRPADAPSTLAHDAPWLMAFLFGLLHGLGFARALVEIGLPAGRLPLALFSFNLGVETGQLAFVAVIGAPAAALQQAGKRWRVARLVPAYGIGIVAAGWTIERVWRIVTGL